MVDHFENRIGTDGSSASAVAAQAYSNCFEEFADECGAPKPQAEAPAARAEAPVQQEAAQQVRQGEVAQPARQREVAQQAREREVAQPALAARPAEPAAWSASAANRMEPADGYTTALDGARHPHYSAEQQRAIEFVGILEQSNGRLPTAAQMRRLSDLAATTDLSTLRQALGHSVSWLGNHSSTSGVGVRITEGTLPAGHAGAPPRFLEIGNVRGNNFDPVISLRRR